VSGRHGHADNRIGSLRDGLLVLVVCLAAGFVVTRALRDRPADPEPVRLTRPAMGTLVDVILPDPGDDPAARGEAAAAARAALAEVARLDSLFSWRLPPPAQMSPGERRRERREVLEVALEVQRLAGGAFETRIMPLVRLWGFDGDQPAVPPADSLAAVVADLAALPAPADAAELESRPDALHFGAWAKGYAVDRACAVLRAGGEPAALVNAGGEIRGFGRDWAVGIRHPRLPGAVLARLRPGDLAVATSGDYEQFFEQDGERYHHLLDPRDGRPARGCRSVTVLARTCARADALATAVFVLGPREGLALIERLTGVECLLIDAAGERHESSGLGRYLAEGASIERTAS
jgi:thiamine biosynthesis lipoprotein